MLAAFEEVEAKTLAMLGHHIQALTPYKELVGYDQDLLRIWRSVVQPRQ